jgi:urease subunit gamma/beta
MSVVAQLVPISGDRVVHGFRGLVDGPLDSNEDATAGAPS